MTHKTTLPDLSEFIDLTQRRSLERRHHHGFPALQAQATVAIYDTKSGYQTLTVRLSEEVADKLGLIEGAKLTCHLHPDGEHLALKPARRKGSSLFRPPGGRALVYQTSLRAGTMLAQKATPATVKKVSGAFVISLTQE